MSEKQKTYGQYCGCARALDLIGERWTILLVRDMLLGPRTFNQLLGALPGLTPTLLTKRLKGMRERGLITQVKNEQDGRSKLYSLTEMGLALEGIILSLGDWGQRYHMQERLETDRRDPGWALLSLKRRFIGPLDCVTEIRCPDGRIFQQKIEGNQVTIRESKPDHADLEITYQRDGIYQLFFSPLSFQVLKAKQLVQIFGPEAQIQAWCQAFGIAYH